MFHDIAFIAYVLYSYLACSTFSMWNSYSKIMAKNVVWWLEIMTKKCLDLYFGALV